MMSPNPLDFLLSFFNQYLFIEAKNNIKRNLNVNLLIDKLIIEMCGD